MIVKEFACDNAATIKMKTSSSYNARQPVPFLSSRIGDNLLWPLFAIFAFLAVLLFW